MFGITPIKPHMSIRIPKQGWHESRTINKERRTASRCVITYRGMYIHFEICCVWLIDRFKWMLTSETLGIHSNLIAEAGKIKKEEVKLRALLLVKEHINNRLREAEELLEEQKVLCS